MAPRSEEQNRIIRDERREELLIHAAYVFAKKGYAATKISDVSQSASLSPGLVYHYFESKEDMFIATLSQLIESTNRKFNQILELSCEPIEKIRILTRQNIDGSEIFIWRFFLQVCLAESVPQKAHDLLEHNFFGIKYLKSIIEEGQKKEQFSTDMDANALTLAYWSIMQGFVFYRDLKVNDLEAEVFLPDVELILKILK